MLTRCPSCATHFRVTPEQLKTRSGRVRCGKCQSVFNALDSLIAEPVAMPAPMTAVTVPPAPTLEPTREPTLEPSAAPEPEPIPPATPLPPQSVPAAPEEFSALPPVTQKTSVPKPPAAAKLHVAEQATADAGAIAEAATEDWITTFPEAPPPRRWPWVIGSLLALTAMVLQGLLAFRVELAVLWPQGKPALLALCEIADCKLGLPTKVALVGIEASDLHPADGEHKNLLTLAATLKNRAPFAQQFPHLELTLTDTVDQAIARKVLAPADYLASKTAIPNGMPPNADIMVSIGIDTGEMMASGYRLYLFYP